MTPLHTLLLLVRPLLASEPAWYDTDSVAASSELFRRAANQTSARFERIQGSLAEASEALEVLDRNAALCGQLAVPAFQDYALSLRRQTMGQYLKIQAHADLLADDFQNTFTIALDRAVPTVGAGYQVEACKSNAVQAMMGRAAPCEGTNLSTELAAALDQDPRLAAEVKDILGVPWPAFVFEGQTQAPAPLTGTDNTISIQTLADALTGERIAAIEAAYAAAVEPLEEGLESDDAAQHAAAMSAGEAARADYMQAMGKVGADLASAVKEALPSLQKKGIPASLALCPNPSSLGGCTGTDITGAAIPILSADKKVRKALKKSASGG